MIAYRRIALTYAGSLLVEIFNRIAPLIIIHFVTARIGVEGFGYAQMGMQLVDVAIYFIIAGYHTIGAIDVGEARGDVKKIREITANLISLKMVHAIAAGILLYGVTMIYTDYAVYRPIIVALSFLLVTTALDVTFINVGTQRVFLTSMLTLAGRSIALVLILMCVRHPDDATLYATLSFGSNAFISVLNLLYNRQYVRLGFSDSARLYGLFLMALPFALTTILLTLLDRFDLFIAEALGGLTFAGLYAAPARIYFSIILILHVVSNVFFSELLRVSKDKTAFSKHIQVTLLALMLLVMPLICGVWFVDEDIIRLLAGEQFISSAHVLSLLMLCTLPQVLIMVFGHLVMQTQRRSNLYNLHLLLGLIAACGFCWGFGHVFGLIGIAAGIFIAKSLVGLSLLRYARSYLLPMNIGLLGRIALAASVMSGVLGFSHLHHLWFNVVLGACVYGLGLMIFARREVSLVFQAFRRRKNMVA